MKWNEVKVYTTSEGIEPVTAVLMDCGISGIEIHDDEQLKTFISEGSMYWDYVDEELLNKENEETFIKFYVPENPQGREQYINAENAVKNLKNTDIGIDTGRLCIEVKEDLNDEDWLNKWKEFYKPFNIGEKILIKPIWEKVENPFGRIVFSINPGHVFGTGLHQSTRLCIEQLEKYVKKGCLMADLGCGSGILSIISLLLGAEFAFAVDIDENAVKTAYENAEFNGIDKSKYYVAAGNIVTDASLLNKIGFGKYDIVAANIIADVICDISQIVSKILKKDGIFISSGIIRERTDDVKDALSKSGMEITGVFTKDEWVSITAVNKLHISPYSAMSST